MSKFPKKLLSILIAAVILVSTAAAAFAADLCDCGNTPVILVSGFGATTLVKINEDGSEETAFPFSADTAVKVIAKNFIKYGTDDISVPIANSVADLVEPIRSNPDGTSYYNIKPIYSSAEDTSFKAFKNNNALKYIPYAGSEFLDMESVSEKVGDDHVFNFLYDWRLSADEIADELLEYIEDVISLTRHSKVSIYCLSQGSVPVAQYVYKYADKGYVENLVFDNPILDGAQFVSNIFCTDTQYRLSFEEIIKLVGNIIHTEIDVSALGRLIPDAANSFATMGAEQIVLPIAKSAPAFLEMIPSKDYDRICSQYFNQKENEPLLATVAKVRNGYMKDIPAMLRSAQANSIDVSIISCSGLAPVNDSGINSDGIVDLTSSCGAYCLPMGETFPDGYIQQKDIGKNCISPDRSIDLSCGYLPERTWIINELFHGQIEWAPNSLALTEKLLYTHEIKDAWSDIDFPQFMQSDDPSVDLHLSFDQTNCLYGIMNGSGLLTLKNTSRKHSMLIKSTVLDGKKQCLNRILAPGEELSLNVDTSSAAVKDAVISYCESDNALNIKERVFRYSVTDNYSGLTRESSQGDNAENVPCSAIGCLWSFTSDIFNLTVRILKGVFLHEA